MTTLDYENKQLTMVYSAGSELQDVVELMRSIGLRCQPVEAPEELREINPAIALLDASITRHHDMDVWRNFSPSVIILTFLDAGEGADLFLPADKNPIVCKKMIHIALQKWNLKEHTHQLHEKNQLGAQHLQQMASIGIALSAEKDLNTLLEKILEEGKKLAGCDAASLFLVTPTGPHERELVFKLALNDSVKLPFAESSVPIDDKSISGYVTNHACELNIDDVYLIPATEPYSYNVDFDEQAGYRCVSLLAIPMLNYRNEVIGLIEFINCKKNPHLPLLSADQALNNTLPFDDNITTLLRALTSQSAIAIEHSVLLESINRLFEGFVNASVAAIEQRDPTTSGHSFRVADLSVELAQCINHSSLIQHPALTDQDLKQLRYAALLHDFGKVGVRENILMKSKKLFDWQLHEIHARFKYLQERVQHRIYFELYQAQKENRLSPALEQQLLQRLSQEQKALKQMLQSINEANEPALLEDSGLASLQHIRLYHSDYLDSDLSLISDDELSALSIRRGSLTVVERQEIEAHVVHTLDFLKLIPWTPELANIPDIAVSHHEKLDGSGYPSSLHADDIPLASKVMTICDIYDALTASDRPYKKAINKDRAFSILVDEANRGKLDNDLVRMFIDTNIPKCLDAKSYPQSQPADETTYHHHVCDLDIPDHSGHE